MRPALLSGHGGAAEPGPRMRPPPLRGLKDSAPGSVMGRTIEHLTWAAKGPGKFVCSSTVWA